MMSPFGLWLVVVVVVYAVSIVLLRSCVAPVRWVGEVVRACRHEGWPSRARLAFDAVGQERTKLRCRQQLHCFACKAM